MTDADHPSTLRDGRYAIFGVLGHGSQAETYDAVDQRDGRAVAIKRFQVRGAKGWKDVELAEREARVLATLSHPNLPVYVEHFEEAGALYLVMHKIEGETLAALRKRRATLSLDDLTRFLTDADSALGFLHSRVPPLIHRDIKPGNVIRRADGSFAIVDFGSVRDQLKPEGGSTVVGTFGYMAPEQFQGRALPGSDVYAVGATAIALYTGSEPEDLPHRGLAIDVRAALGSGAEPWLVRVLEQMLDPDPDKRARRVPAPGSGRRREATREAPPRDDDWRALRERGRAERRRLRDESHNLRSELKQQVRDEARRVRRALRRNDWHEHRHAWPMAPLLLGVIVLALTAARVATFWLFRVFLPFWLYLLSLVFGRPLRRAAQRLREVGIAGDHGLRHASFAVRQRLLGPPSGRETPARMRVAIDVPPEADELDFEAPFEPGKRRESR